LPEIMAEAERLEIPTDGLIKFFKDYKGGK
jgi:hypothetical protein